VIQDPNMTKKVAAIRHTGAAERTQGTRSVKIAIFTLPKPFTDPHIDLIQCNAIRSWTALGADVEVILMGDDDGIDSVAKELGTKHYSSIRKNENGTPLLSDAFRAAVELSDAEVLVYCNCDVILLSDLVASIDLVQANEAVGSFVAFGRRIDLDVTTEIDFAIQWHLGSCCLQRVFCIHTGSISRHPRFCSGARQLG